MERLLNDQWTFAKLPSGSGVQDAWAAEWTSVDLPHDFLIEDANNLYETCDGWYRRVLNVEAADLDKVWLLNFDGVYMDCDVLVNGTVVATHHYGYTAFDVDLTGTLLAGENELLVHIRHHSPNTRWYSGAGIFRDVTLYVLPEVHIDRNSIFLATSHDDGEQCWTVWVNYELNGVTSCHQDTDVLIRILNREGLPVHISRTTNLPFTCSDVCAHPWSPDHPYLYTLELTCGEQIVRKRFGLRALRMDPDEGLFINEQPIKMHGVCLHHDLGALGSAFHEKAARRQLRIMQDMGVNALRTSHNPPASKLLDLCDEMGVLVIDEFTDMWEMPKTNYDYARFFDEDVAEDVKSWVCRDRCHASVIMWSIGNEILDTHASIRGAEVTQLLKNLVEMYDDPADGHAVVTIGSNYMPWEGAQRCAEILKIAGYNYGEKYYEEHHEKHPDWVIYGSETASSLSSRGIYHFPIETNILSDEDLQCSTLGNSTSSWGCRDLRKMIVDDMNCPYSMGQFIWSGIDYIGEPTPYHTRSCYFGHVDTAGFPKDGFYQFRSIWRDVPMAHIGVYWCWNEGQLIDVPVMTTGSSCELFLNGVSLGVKQVDRSVWQESLPTWKVPYQPGVLSTKAYDETGAVIAEDARASFGSSARIMLESEDASLLGNGHDMTFVTVSTVDADGHPVENAIDRVHVSVTGAGRLLGLDNGDSTDLDGYKTTTRHLFSGKLLVMVGALNESGTVRIEVTSPNLPAAVLELPVEPAAPIEGQTCVQRIADVEMPMDVPVRCIDLKPLGSTHLNKENPAVTFAVRTLPENADTQALNFRIVTSVGISSPCADWTRNADGSVTVTARGDGMVYLRATCNNGDTHARIISQQEIIIEGMGQPYLDPYEFIAGGLYDIADGEISSGNEQGLSFARESYSMAGFSNVDFGPVGSDEITLPIFSLNDEVYRITLYQGDPRYGGEKICTLDYSKPSIWNTYQSETYKLPVRLTGVQTLCFSMEEKVHMKGFSFTRQARAWQPQSTLNADHLYGDSFERTDEGVMNIGNNVSLVFEGMDFGDAEKVRLTIDAATPLNENPINVVMNNRDGQEQRILCSFAHSEQRTQQSFELPVLPGECTVSFVFLPGCQFDFYGFQFEQL